MKPYLLDVNVLVALFSQQHTHFKSAQMWFENRGKTQFATCAMVQTAWIRIAVNPKVTFPAFSFSECELTLKAFCQHQGHQFWSDDLDLSKDSPFPWTRLTGNKQVTDAYLLTLAANHKGTFATFDRAVAKLAPAADLVELIDYVG